MQESYQRGKTLEKSKENNIGKENKWERRVRVQHQHSMGGGDAIERRKAKPNLKLAQRFFFFHLIYFKIRYLTALLLNMTRNYKTHN